MDEYIEILDRNGIPTGKRCWKSEAHDKGYFHASVHIWLYTANGEILVQQRKTTKDTFPGLWDVSVAGHISFGESILRASTREIKEEIGLSIPSSKLHLIGTSTHKHVHQNGIIDHELHHLFITETSVPMKNIKIQQEEVAAIQMIPLVTFESELKVTPEKYVPHGALYYQKITSAIKNRLSI
jgi:isopentenyldiphosphate isomerase